MHSMTAAADGLSLCLPMFLPGQITLERGTRDDYAALVHLHYVTGNPATWAGVWRAAYRDGRDGTNSRVIAVGVLSYPTPSHRVRERVLRLSGPRYGEKLRFINQHVRTISRVIVHPQFRGLGIASLLVRRICEECPTRYVEAIAAMGEVHPLFEKGGMRKIEGEEGGRAYFFFDRERD